MDGKLHRDNDLPAVQMPNGTLMWYSNGVQHRAHGLPAVEFANGGKIWYEHGCLHRADGLPAVHVANGTRKWYVHGLCHRGKNLPAIILDNGRKEWWVRGRRHRCRMLPAIVDPIDNVLVWFVNNRDVTQGYELGLQLGDWFIDNHDLSLVMRKSFGILALGAKIAALHLSTQRELQLSLARRLSRCVIHYHNYTAFASAISHFVYEL